MVAFSLWMALLMAAPRMDLQHTEGGVNVQISGIPVDSSWSLLRVVGTDTTSLGTLTVPETSFVDTTLPDTGTVTYLLRRPDGTYAAQAGLRLETAPPSESGEGETPAPPGWFNTDRAPILIFLILFGIAFFLFVQWTRAGRPIFIRKIAGLEALDDAVGRSTEMGRPILYVPGMTDLDTLPTLSALSILKYVTKKSAEYATPMLVPLREPLVMAAAQEIMKEAYLEAGRPDLYEEDRVYFTTVQQFGYASTVAGTMMREKPGAIFLMGYYYAESLIMAETGNTVGAIQVAGTPAVDQLPFFIAACDYTLIGEEFYAASAYLSQRPEELATLKAEDIFKALFVGMIALGSLLTSLGIPFLSKLLEVH